MKIYVSRKIINGQTWFRVMDSDGYVDGNMLSVMKQHLEIRDLDAIQAEREYQARWN